MATIQEQERIKKQRQEDLAYVYQEKKEKINSQKEKLVKFVEEIKKIDIKNKDILEDKLLIDRDLEPEPKLDPNPPKSVFDYNYFEVLNQLDDIEIKLAVNKAINNFCKRLNPKSKCFRCVKKNYKKARDILIKELGEEDNLIEDLIDIFIKLGKRQNKKEFWEKAREYPKIALEFLKKIKLLDI